MATKIVQNVEDIRSGALATELFKLFREARNVRTLSGVTEQLRFGYVRDTLEDGDLTEFINLYQEDCSDGCTSNDAETDGCDPELSDACSLEDQVKRYKQRSPFKSLATLLTTVKKYEYISLVENAYAQIGNKPFKLKAGKDPVLTEDQIKKSAKTFYEFLEKFLEKNEVRINEITEAFNVNTLSDVTKAMADQVQSEAEIKVDQDISKNEAVIERIFQRSDFMTKYIEAMKDTADYPIGILWMDDHHMKKQRVIKSGKLEFKYTVQTDVHRVDPCYFWATEDHRINEVGRAVFRMSRYSRGDLERWRDADILGSSMLKEDMTKFIQDNPDGRRMYEAMLFNDNRELDDGLYDVVICRGTFDKRHVEQLGIEIPKLFKFDSHIPCEIYFSSTNILRVRVMETADDRLGVYTTTFRRRGSSIFGWSLNDFIYPFAKLYAGTIEGIDKSVGKSIGSLIQIDTGVIEDPDKYLKKNEDTGEVELDLSEDVIIEFDSTQAFGANQFKGIPITIDQLPSDLSKLLPVIDFVNRELERISGIPNILVSATNISSALRTNSNFNASFAASAKVVQSLLREGEVRMLEPAIVYIFDAEAMSGNMGEFLSEVEPEILLSDTLTREINDDQQLIQNTQLIAQFAQYIPAEKIARLINNLGRQALNLTEDLIPDVGVLDTTTASTPTQSV